MLLKVNGLVVAAHKIFSNPLSKCLAAARPVNTEAAFIPAVLLEIFEKFTFIALSMACC